VCVKKKDEELEEAHKWESENGFSSAELSNQEQKNEQGEKIPLTFLWPSGDRKNQRNKKT
jgi:hypothetical protein